MPGTMRIRKFADLFHAAAIRDMVLLWVDPPGQQLPVRQYALVEYYCDEPDCDCRRVLLELVSTEYSGRTFASIGFGWESLEFYRAWAAPRGLGEATPLKQGVLDHTRLNCDWADLLLAQVRQDVLADPKAVARFKKHYTMVKREQRQRANGPRAEPE